MTDAFDTNAKPLDLSDDEALFRALQFGGREAAHKLACALYELAKPCKYTNEDIEKRGECRRLLADMRAVGRTPFKRYA